MLFLLQSDVMIFTANKYVNHTTALISSNNLQMPMDVLQQLHCNNKQLNSMPHELIDFHAGLPNES